MEVRRIRWQLFERMTRLPCEFFCAGSFVDCRIVHDHNRFRRQLRDQVLFKPKIEEIGADICAGQPNAPQNLAKQGPDHIDTPPRMPILRSKTALAG